MTWTPDTIKEHFDQRIIALRDLIEQHGKTDDDAIDNLRLALDKFEMNVAARFIQVNEFRSALDDLGKTMATRRELEAAMVGMEQHYEENRRNIGELRSRLDAGPSELRALQTRADMSQGRSEGVNHATAMVLTLVAFFTPLITGLLVWAITQQ